MPQRSGLLISFQICTGETGTYCACAGASDCLSKTPRRSCAYPMWTAPALNRPAVRVSQEKATRAWNAAYRSPLLAALGRLRRRLGTACREGLPRCFRSSSGGAARGSSSVWRGAGGN